ncbi:hypothetical protein TrVE_jg8362 [Triparma verrucosa]|uniref:WW domain-containing protein n=1 Tax=Triparma verrucosa TaxID=1606542 RepID=A0A9W7F8D4_9STRA|nr:hypothetical protein TrVE_jg8362 [Triparma verrucosa]
MGTTCEPCEKVKWKAEAGVTSCSLCSSTLEDSITKDFGSTSAKDCKCPKGTYDDGKGKCEVVQDGMDDTAFGMCLENVTVDPGYWRVNSDSTDVRKCLVSEACTGGNSTNYCREGHTGPYCDLCVDGWTKDPLMLCKSCENSIVDVIPWWMLVAAVLGSLIYISKKKSRNPEEHRKKLLKKYRSSCFTSAIAITYLVLPTVTTKIFGLFPCDELDDGSEMLMKDYTISCQDGSRDFWEAYGWLMVGVFPIGVISMYSFLLWSKRARLKTPVEQRLEDEKITPLLFLWEPYKPEFWYWEVIETGRRLMMTGVLSTIKPGSFSQLVAGQMMNTLYLTLLCLARPYNDNRDNSIAVLSTLQIIIVFVAAMLMHASKLFTEDNYDAEAFYQKDNMSTSSNGMVIKNLKGPKKKKKKKEKKNDEEEGRGVVVEMTDVGVDIGLGSRTNSVFKAENPMTRKGGEQISGGFRQEGGESEQWEATEDEDGNQYWYDESSGRTTWSDKSQS